MISFPSILEKTPESLISQINKLSEYFNHFQIDIADGIFVSNKTVQIEDIEKFIIRSNLTKVRPNIFKNSFEFHLMVQNYQGEIDELITLKKFLTIDTVLIHIKTIDDFSHFSDWHSQFSKEFNIGIVFNPEDDVMTISKRLDLNIFPLIQIMTVQPGVQGNPFIKESLQKIEQLRVLDYRNKISLDGAINEVTLPFILPQKYKPDIVCPGSYLTKTEELQKHVSYLRTLS